MNTTIKTLSILIVFSIINEVPAGESGLLLGLRYGVNYDVSATLADKKAVGGTQSSSSYRTFWIHGNGEKGQIELVAERTNLLVPRDDGFWRVDVKHSRYNDFTEDFIWINPAHDPDALPNPFLAEQEGINAFDVSLLVKESGIEPAHGEYCKGYVSRDILLVENGYLSVGYIRNEVCQSFAVQGDSALQMLSMGKLEPVSITAKLDDNGQKAFANAAKEYQDATTKKFGDVSGGIVREPGRWVIKGHFPIDEGGYTHFGVPITVGESLVSHNKLYPSWDTVKKHVPDAVDAFSSPAKDLLVVLTNSGNLLGFIIKRGKISQQPVLHVILKYPLTPVMAYWTSGQYVTNWTQEIQNLSPTPKESWFVKTEIASVKKPTSKIVGVVVTPNTLNIRQGMGQHTKPIARIERGTKVNVLNVLGKWYKVRLDSGQIGYTHSDYIKILPGLPYVQDACPVKNCVYEKWELKKPATLYAEPSSKADALATLATQQVVQALHGEIHTSQFGEIEVVKSELKLTDGDKKLILHKGDRLFDLEPVGLDMHLMWYNGELYYLSNGWNPKLVSEDALWGTTLTERKTDWWVNVEIPTKKLTGWIVNPSF